MENPLPFDLPSSVPGITLPDVVLFPQGSLPLYIFEPRYRRMLEEVMDSSGLMLVVTRDADTTETQENPEPFHPQATLGMVQSSEKNPDGTSQIVIQGLLRVQAGPREKDEPYPVFSIRPVPSEPGADSAELESRVQRLLALVRRRSELDNRIPRELLRFLEGLDDPDALTDLTAHTLIGPTAEKLRLLETPEVTARFERLFELLGQEIKELDLEARLRGGLSDDDVSRN
jgi:Lon protease-like protein